jgi:hypothetical protein
MWGLFGLVFDPSLMRLIAHEIFTLLLEFFYSLINSLFREAAGMEPNEMLSVRRMNWRGLGTKRPYSVYCKVTLGK